MSDSGRTQRPGSTTTTAPRAATPASPALPSNAPATSELFGADRGRPVQRDRADAASQIGRTLTAWRKASGPGGRAGAIPQANSPLDGGVRGRMESAMGTSLGDVRVGTGAESAVAASSMNARAFTVGNEVHFGSGQYSPGTRDGDSLIAHELTHVAQGNASGVRRKATDGAAGAHDHDHGHEVSDPSEPAEKEADAMSLHATAKLHDGAAHAPGGKPTEKAPPIAAKLDGVGRKVYRTNQPPTPRTTTPAPTTTPATNPDFEKDAIAFETALGGKAMSNGAANGATLTLINKCRDMIKMIALKGREGADKQHEYETAFNQQLSALMGNAPLPKNQGIAGAVGDDVATLNEVFAEGNLRERMTILFNFMRPFSNTLVQADVQDREKFITQLNLDGATIRQRLDAMKTNAKAQLVGDPTQKVVNMQNQSREDSGNDKESSRQAGALPKGAELSKRETKFQGLKAKPDGSIDETVQQTLKWKEGADKWRAKESSDYAQKLKSLKLPFGAGPSGTTDRIMSMAQLLGFGDPFATRLACIGYLLPIRAHSLHEILTAAAVYGCDFTDGQKMYRNIKPLGEGDLRACGGGKFPDEPKTDTPPPSTTHHP